MVRKVQERRLIIDLLGVDGPSTKGAWAPTNHNVGFNDVGDTAPAIVCNFLLTI
jgi:hypothetical protein